jgi:hypothetical protein
MVALEFDSASKAEVFHTAVDKLWRQADGQNQGEPAVRILEAVERQRVLNPKSFQFWLVLLLT